MQLSSKYFIEGFVESCRKDKYEGSEIFFKEIIFQLESFLSL